MIMIAAIKPKHSFRQVPAIISIMALLVFYGCSGQKKDLPPADKPDDSIPATFVDTDVMLWLTKADSSVRFSRQNVALNFSLTPPAGNSIS